VFVNEGEERQERCARSIIDSAETYYSILLISVTMCCIVYIVTQEVLMDTNTMTIRLPAKFKSRLARLAKVTERSKSWLAADAIRTYLELQEWQIKEIKSGVKEANAGDFASETEVEAVFTRWRGNGR
jgi:RHH-type rel operon transcriptional repressor/antitoxin RelB